MEGLEGVELNEESIGVFVLEWVKSQSGTRAVKDINKNLKYGANLFNPKKKALLVTELFCFNTALAIYAVNQIFDHKQSKKIIDNYLNNASSLFGAFENSMPNFRNQYEQRMNEYFISFEEDNPALALSFSFLKNVYSGEPQLDIKKQMYVAASTSAALNTLLEFLSDIKSNQK